MNITHSRLKFPKRRVVIGAPAISSLFGFCAAFCPVLAFGRQRPFVASYAQLEGYLRLSDERLQHLVESSEFGGASLRFWPGVLRRTPAWRTYLSHITHFDVFRTHGGGPESA